MPLLVKGHIITLHWSYDIAKHACSCLGCETKYGNPKVIFMISSLCLFLVLVWYVSDGNAKALQFVQHVQTQAIRNLVAEIVK